MSVSWFVRVCVCVGGSLCLSDCVCVCLFVCVSLCLSVCVCVYSATHTETGKCGFSHFGQYLGHTAFNSVYI